MEFETASNWDIFAPLAFMGGFFIVFAIIYIILMIMQLLNIYDWGTRDSAKFPGGTQGKKTWFYKFFLLPMGMIIPILNFVVAIVYAVFVLQYFFKIRGKEETAMPKVEEEKA